MSQSALLKNDALDSNFAKPRQASRSSDRCEASQGGSSAASEASASAEDAAESAGETAVRKPATAWAARRRERMRRLTDGTSISSRIASSARSGGLGREHGVTRRTDTRGCEGQQTQQAPSGGRRTATKVAKSMQLGVAAVGRTGGIFQCSSSLAGGHVAGVPTAIVELPRGKFRASSRPRHGPSRGQAVSRRGERGPTVSAVRGRLPPMTRSRHATAVRAASSRSRSRQRTSLNCDHNAFVGTPSVNQPCEDNCYAYSLAASIDVARLEAAWMESLRKRSSSIRAGQIGRKASDKDRAANASARAGQKPPETASIPEDIFVVPLSNALKLLKVGHKDCIVFAFGCLVCWGCNQDEAARAKDVLRPFLSDSLAAQNVDEDRIDISLRDGSLMAALSSREPPTFERVAVAYALAQSVRLGTLELRVDRWIAKTRNIPEQKAMVGNVSLRSESVTQLVGEFFSLKHEVNLETDILDTPEFFWKYSEYEPTYQSCRDHLDVDQRVSVLNQRFEVLQEILEVLENELNARNGNRLKSVVIVLCACQALVMAVRYYHRVWVVRSDMDGSFPHEVRNSTAATAFDIFDSGPDVKVMPILWLLRWSLRLIIQYPLAALGKGLNAASSAMGGHG
eukprot:TRINITY_DN44022_c0_g1_i1.p1 TRINITY_DN44022_c0_g1~~TRINITY_DN44022_c0_g1_i1.p1  ORF type:complete len:626 (+),score=69.23 TRINITY_DN44022_c0_g1_i1:41-1918(+)